MIPLCETVIRQFLDNESVEIYCLDSIDSTNQFLKELPSKPTIRVCCAETQTQGRGRFARQWYSPPYENIYLSIRRKIRMKQAHRSCLSLVVSLAIMNTLHGLGLHEDLSIKWPNDILWHQSKLSGCLIELISSTPNAFEVVIGIGLNVHTITTTSAPIDRPWCSLYEISGKHYDRNHLIAQLVQQLNQTIDAFAVTGFTVFLPQWLAVDGLLGKPITVSLGQIKHHGMAQGVSALGELILKKEDGTLHYFNAGEASLSQPFTSI